MSYDTPHRKPSVNRQVFLLGALLNLGYLAACIHKSSRVYLFQQAQCLTYYKIHDPTKIDSQYRVEEALCKLDDIQSPLSIIDGIDSFLQFLPALLVLATFKELLVVVGLRHLIMLSMTCSGLGVLFSTVVCAFIVPSKYPICQQRLPYQKYSLASSTMGNPRRPSIVRLRPDWWR
ncbi:hypothetical protein ABVK25_009818 [Lepraria finkii]|uniref:Uncharacterized protein n=1 Tax=Lepraria finkii TaxID=1340010 RepID=A0ABR4AZ29_9LECA